MSVVAESELYGLLDGARPASQRRFPESRTSKYLRGGHRSVEGWLTPFSGQTIALLLEEQSRTGVRGSVGEIGVHHGKLFLIEYLSTRTDESAFAIDLFEQQQFNVDESGKGDRERLMENINRHAGSVAGLIVMPGDSRRLTAGQIIERAGRARFFSVDGGHTEECTRNDLSIAEACLADGGIVVLDDYFNHLWPDVSVGAASYFLSPAAKTKPFLITPNKVFFAEERYHPAYQQAVRKDSGNRYARSCRMFGAAVDIYVLDGLRGLFGTVARLAGEEARMHLAHHPNLKRLVKSLLAR